MLVFIMIGILSLTACSMYPAITPVEQTQVKVDEHNIAQSDLEGKDTVQVDTEQVNGQSDTQHSELNKVAETTVIDDTNAPKDPLKSDSEGDFNVDFEKQPIVDITEVTEHTKQPEEKEPAATPTQEASNVEHAKVIALTFDDGPDAKYTPQVLDILKEKGIKATFFLVGIQIKKYPEVVQRMVDEGHLIANHTYNHPKLTKLTQAEILKELDSTDDLLESIVGFKPTVVRPPYGSLNDQVRKTIEDTGRDIVLWNIDPRDWASTPVNEMYENVMSNARDQGNILFHSFGGKQIQNTVDLLPKIIDALTAEGYTFVTADYYLNS